MNSYAPAFSVPVKISVFLALLTATVIAPLAIHSQAVTGTFVNAALFATTVILGPAAAILLGLIPSIIAFASGTLPAPLAPMIPFIMLGNTVLVVVFHYARRKSAFSGIGLAALLKFALLYGAAYFLISKILPVKIAPALLAMMSWPQLFTALAGGLAAYTFLRSTKKI